MDGYEVKRIDMPYDDWRALVAQTKGKDPTLLGLGYKSRAVIGKHPTGVLLIDDIHDENNTRSGRELEMVRQVLAGTTLPTVTAETWQVVVGTPWVGCAVRLIRGIPRFSRNDSVCHTERSEWRMLCILLKKRATLLAFQHPPGCLGGVNILGLVALFGFSRESLASLGMTAVERLFYELLDKQC
jgi:hypothetical protein